MQKAKRAGLTLARPANCQDIRDEHNEEDK